ncbi:unnamed protein product [Sphagnum tenellum]
MFTENESMFNAANQTLSISLGGLSLTVVAFTIAFLCHSIGGGLFCGVAIYRLTHSVSMNTDRLAKSMVVLTIVQPLVSLHPLIAFLVAFTVATNWIMRSEANHNSENPLSCIVPLVIAVFIWMMCTSYVLLCLAMDNQPIEKAVGATDPADSEFKADGPDELEHSRYNVAMKEFIQIYSEGKEEAGETEATVKHHRKDDTRSCFFDRVLGWIWLLLIERLEYNDPSTYGWRVMFRRSFLMTGVAFFTFVAYQLTIETQNFDSKVEIQQLLVHAGTNLTWPEGDSALDDAFNTYNSMQEVKAYVMIMACCCFWASLAFDLANRTLHLSAAACVGDGGARLVRASVLVLLHPALRVAGDLNLENKIMVDSNSKKSILMQVLKFSSLLAFPVTLIALAIVDQVKKDLIVKELIITFWIAPPLILFAGLHFYRNRLKVIYYLYMFCYCAPLIALCCYCFAWTKLIEVLRDLILKPTFITGFLAEFCICNVVISDILYMTVF